jgi:pimeloyl-ACP methyl ester carboxylesterase
MRSQVRPVVLSALILACGGAPSIWPLPAAVDSDLPRRPKAPAESYAHANVIYDSVRDSRGERARVILTRPREGSGKYPAIFVAGWLSCDSVEAPADTNDASGKVFRVLAELPGFVTVRMDKPGVGDSEGVCRETDFETELSAYRAAFRSLSRYDFIDPAKVFVFGISNGGGFAPLVAEDAPVRGYVIDGAWIKTWFEHMMEIERRRFVLSGKRPSEVNDLMRLEARLYEAYLLEKQRPAEVLARHPDLRAAWAGDDDDHLYGRPIVFYQQLQQLNLESAWSKVSVPVLALHGQYDWIMSRDDHERIVELVNLRLPGAAKFVELPATGHTFEHYENAQAAFKFKEAAFDPRNANMIADWFRQHR